MLDAIARQHYQITQDVHTDLLYALIHEMIHRNWTRVGGIPMASVIIQRANYDSDNKIEYRLRGRDHHHMINHRHEDCCFWISLDSNLNISRFMSISFQDYHIGVRLNRAVKGSTAITIAKRVINMLNKNVK